MKRLVFSMLFLFAMAGGSAIALDLDPALIASWPRVHEQPLTGGVVEGDHAYCTTDRALVIFDVSDILAPRAVGSLDGLKLAGWGRLTVSGGYAYLTYSGPAAGKDGVIVIDVSDPARPRKVGAAPNHGRKMVISGPYAYLATHDGLEVLDLTDPIAPRLAGSLRGADLEDIAVQGAHAYAADGHAGGLRILDIRNPASPRELAHYDEDGSLPGAADVVLHRHFVYFTFGRPSYARGTLGLDVGDPASPRPIHRGWMAIPRVIAGDRAYSAWSVVDLSDPARPERLASWDPGPDPGYLGGEVLSVSGGRLLVAGPGGLHVLDVADPVSPARVGRGDATVDGIDTGDEMSLVAVLDDRLYLAGNARTGQGTTLQVFDVSDPALPRREGTARVDVTYLMDRAVSGKHAYLVEHDGGNGLGVLHIHDVSDPANMRKESSVPLRGRGWSVFVAGEQAYTGDDSGLVVFDVRDPVAPRRAGDIDTGRPASKVFVAAGHAYVLSESLLQVIDVSVPSSPRLVAEHDEGPGAAGIGIDVAGNHAYVTFRGEEVLHIFDVSVPAMPRLAGSIGVRAGDIAVSGNLACVAAGGIHVIDVSDPGAPRALHRHHQNSDSVASAGGLVYASHYPDGFEVLDPGAPPALPPAVVVHEAAPALGEDPVLSGRFAYVETAGGFLTLDLGDPVDPRPAGRYRSTLSGPWQWRLNPHRELVVSGDVVYLSGVWSLGAAFTTVLEVVDASDPADPRLLGWHEADGDARLASASGRLAYFQRAGGLDILDVGDPARPLPAGRHEDPDLPEGAAVFAAGEHALVGKTAGFEVLDARDPRAPRVVASRAGRLVAVAGGRAYVEPEGGGLEILDVRNPADPRLLGEYPGVEGIQYVPGGRVLGRIAGDDGLQWIDASDPVAPRLAGILGGAGPVFGAGGRHLFSATGGAGGFVEVFDVERRANPERLAMLPLADHPAAFELDGNLAYVAAGRSGVQVLEVSDPARPRELGSHDTPGLALDIALDADRVYVADECSGVEILERSDPAGLRRIGGFAMQPFECTLRVAVSGTHAFLLVWSNERVASRVDVLDVGDPADPWPVGTAGGDWRYPGDLVLAGDLLFAAGGEDLHVLDVRIPDVPRVAGTHDTGIISRIAVQGNRVVLATRYEGVLVMDFGDPSAPRRIASYPASESADIALSGDYIFVANGAASLDVVDAGLPEAPRRIGGNPIPPLSGSSGLAVRGRHVFAIREADGAAALLTMELEAPFPPAHVVALAGDGTVDLSWTPPNAGLPAAAYDVYRTGPGPRTRLNATPVMGTAFTAAGLPNGVEHCFAVQASSAGGAASEDSAPACAVPEGPLARFLRGDCDGDGRVEGLVTDAVFLLDRNFRGGPRPPCLAACDADGDGRVEGIVTDAVYLLNFNFLGGPPPAPPFPECGPGGLGTDGALGCEAAPEVCK